MAALIAVGVLAIVQSLFGVGLLLFGTPVLILLGYPFREALLILLPASIAISGLQVVMADRPPPRTEWSRFFLWAVPALIVGLVGRLGLDAVPRIDLALAALLLLGVFLRHAEGVAAGIRRLLATRQRMSLVVIGLVHGFTNMGGAVLAMYAAVRHSTKASITEGIALGYLVLATSQLLVLLWLRPTGGALPSLAAPAIATLVYVLMGRRVWQAVSQRPYQLVFSGFMVLCAGFLTVRQFS